MIDFKILRIIQFGFGFVLQTNDVRCFFIQFLVGSEVQTAVSACRTAAVSVSCCQINQNTVSDFMCGAHLGCHTDDRIVFVQFYRNDKNGFSAGMCRQIFVSVCFYILISGTAEYDRSQCLSVFDRYLVTGDIDLSGTAGPAEFVRFVYTVFQFRLAVDCFGGTTGVGFVFGFAIRLGVRFCCGISGCVTISAVVVSSGRTVIVVSVISVVSIVIIRNITDLCQIFGTECDGSVVPFVMAFGMGRYGNRLIECGYRNLVCSSGLGLAVQCVGCRSIVFDPVSGIGCRIGCASHIQVIIANTAQCDQCCHLAVFHGQFCSHYFEHGCAGYSTCAVDTICRCSLSRNISDLFQIFGANRNSSVIPLLLTFGMRRHRERGIQCGYRNLIRSSGFSLAVQCIGSCSVVFDPVAGIGCRIGCGSHIQIIIAFTT